MKTLNQYLKERFTPSTVKTYERAINIYLETMEDPANAKYRQIMNFIQEFRKSYSNSDTVRSYMAAVRNYYGWLVFTGQRKDNPCNSIDLKGKNRQMDIDAFLTKTELNLLLTSRVNRYSDLKYRNQVLMSLLLLGLTNEEIVSVKVTDIDIDNAKIRIRGTNRTNGRILNFGSSQVSPLIKYLEYERPKLLKGKKQTDSLIITKLGTPETGEGISYLVSTFKYLFPDKILNPKTIRQSLIVQKYRESHDTREIQIYFGLKWASSAERYKPVDDKAMKEALSKFHPLA